MSNFQEDIQIARKIAKAVDEVDASAYFVGGYVRDKLLKRETKDIDIEVHEIEPRELEKILDSIGKRISIGESFGIYSLKGSGVDIAMPRKEKLLGKGHRDFEVFVDAHIGTKNAAKRRDFTINALMENVLTGEIIDWFGGLSDMENKIIRHVNAETFVEDPLRVLRAAQFAARLDFTVAKETIELCKKIDLSSLSKERVEAELSKALLKSDKPSVFFETLRKTQSLSFWFPEVEALIGVEQNEKYHAEGDVWNHTMMVLDEAVKYRDKVSNPFGFMLAALVHDFGKAVCTMKKGNTVHSYAHETVGLAIVQKFLTRLTNETKIKKYVLNMTENHMKPNVLSSVKAPIKSTNKMFYFSVAPKDLIYFSFADDNGRIKQIENESSEDFLLERLDIFEKTMEKPCVTGKDLIKSGLSPDENFSDILDYATKLRLAGVEKENALKQTLSYAKKIKRK